MTGTRCTKVKKADICLWNIMRIHADQRLSNLLWESPTPPISSYCLSHSDSQAIISTTSRTITYWYRIYCAARLSGQHGGTDLGLLSPVMLSVLWPLLLALALNSA